MTTNTDGTINFNNVIVDLLEEIEKKYKAKITNIDISWWDGENGRLQFIEKIKVEYVTSSNGG